MKFTKTEIQQIEEHGLTVETVQQHLSYFQQSSQNIQLHAPAIIGKGIVQLSSDDCTKLSQFYENKTDELAIIKFVPASGAASRMFKSLYEFLDKYNPKNESINSYINRTNSLDLFLFFVTADKLPFHDEIFEALKQQYPDYKALPLDQRRYIFAQLLLDNNQFNFGHYPKGLLPFHDYKTHIKTAFEEHLIEASRYACVNHKSSLHFTVSKAHYQQFLDHFDSIKNIVEKTSQTTFDVSYSFQDPKTDTIAVSMDNKPFKIKDQLLFRPSGHGALIKNLNALKADVIFIKNIDNVVMEPYLESMVFYKKVLAGLLLELQSKAFEFAEELDGDVISEDRINSIADFLSQKLNVYISPEFEKYANHFKVEYLKSRIHRPIRVCGMVQNEGEPGGGPFWIKRENGELSLQIVELSQIDTTSDFQNDIVKSATHFNPVDIVCGVKNYKGEYYDLEAFVDAKTHFVTVKNKYGERLKTLERPGLWNGGMANWNSVFVEVPLSTFNPVKKASDLLKAQHQLEP